MFGFQKLDEVSNSNQANSNTSSTHGLRSKAADESWSWTSELAESPANAKRHSYDKQVHGFWQDKGATTTREATPKLSPNGVDQNTGKRTETADGAGGDSIPGVQVSPRPAPPASSVVLTCILFFLLSHRTNLL